MNRTDRRSPWTSLCARLTLAAFAAALPGPAAWAQAVARVAPLTTSSLSGAAGASASATPALVPSFRVSAVAAAPLAVPALAAVADSLRASAEAPSPERAGPSQIETLHAAVAGAGDAAAHFDGTHRQSSWTGDPIKQHPAPLTGTALVPYTGPGGRGGADDKKPLAFPRQAPILGLTQVHFPGSGPVNVAVEGSENFALVGAIVRGGGYAIATYPGGGDSAAALVRVRPINPASAKNIEVTVIRAVKIAGRETNGAGIPIARVTYPETGRADAPGLLELATLAQNVLQQFAALDPAIPKTLVNQALDEGSAEKLADMLAENLPLSPQVKLSLLAAPSAEARLQGVIFEMTSHFKGKASAAGGAGSRQKTLDSVENLNAAMRAIGMPAAIQEVMLEEYEKYKALGARDSEGLKTRTYLEWMLSMPWGRRTEDTIDIAKARAILDRDHSGLEAVKERVLEFIALRKKTGTKKGAILVFTGPPGVGKTSIAGAIAESLGRKFVRLSLGGVSDESVIRGHERTYSSSRPGDIMLKMKEAGVINPVMLLDEADKIGHEGPQGDPAAALLEVLDPKQNDTYQDHYLGVPYDLSEVLFVVTANELPSIPEALRSRMEVMEFDGYTTREKLAISRNNLIPQKLAETGLKPEDVSLTPGAIRDIIELYTSEAGVRDLAREFESLLRKISTWPELHDGEAAQSSIDRQDVAKYLGVARYSPRQIAQNGVGLATGLAVNALGGSTFNVEVTVEPGSGQLKLRNQFGKDIEDSAKNALKHVKAHAADYGLGGFDFTKHDVDINFTPAGAIDGPSAGGLMVTAIVSALTKRPVAPDLAMTGEISTRGDILPIGGLKQKVMAAHRLGYKEVIYPFANKKDVETIPKEVSDEMILTPVKTYAEIYRRAIAREERK